MAGHRSPSGRPTPSAAVPARGVPAPARGVPARGAAHRAPAGHLRAHVLATAAAVGAVATGTLTALLPSSSGDAAPPAPATADSTPGPILAASAGFLRSAERMAALEPPATMQPVVYALDGSDQSAATEQRVASVEKAGRLAAQLAQLHAQEQRDQAAASRAAAAIRAGGLDGWIAQALQVMNLPQDLAPGVKQIIMAESGGNPRAVNTWDSNALRGTPSRGLMQTIPSTFRSYVHPDLADRGITDPVANITAGVRYMIDRYGIDTVRAGGRSSSAGSYLGY